MCFIINKMNTALSSLFHSVWTERDCTVEMELSASERTEDYMFLILHSLNSPIHGRWLFIPHEHLASSEANHFSPTARLQWCFMVL